ncbi:hypothetical protein [Bradyrhizobium cenepequi]
MTWKSMVADGQKRRHTFTQPDLFIAAIAALQTLVVVSCDTKEFVKAGVPVFDPWTDTLCVEGERITVKSPVTAETIAGFL